MTLNFKKIISACLAFMILMLPLHVKSAEATTYDEVTLGGCPIGLELNVDGVMVVGEQKESGVLTRAELNENDLIVGANGKKIKNIDGLVNEINSCKSKIDLLVVRDGEKVKVTVPLIKDKVSGKNKLGVMVKDIIQGVGTLTYVKDDLSFGALGHPASMSGKKTVTPIVNGKTTNCLIIGLNKGIKGKAGELKGVFVLNNDLKGSVEKNNMFGVFGKLENTYQNPLYGGKVKVAKREEVEIGKAVILTTIDGNVPKEYTIEIVQKELQDKPSTKSFVIKVTDEELLEKTGGIVQGMSGSPILQNGKFIGAVTHVFVNDPTRGFGLYGEFMVNN